MAQIQKKFIATNAIDGTKLRLNNNEQLKARNAADSADINILKVNASDRIEFASVPQVTADAAAANDLVRYSQIQGIIEGLKPKTAVKAATTAAGTLATSFENGDLIDGYTLVTGDRLLIKDQAAPEENGIYIVAASGAPTRASDFNAVSEISGSYTVAEQGTVNQGTLFVCLSSPTTLGVDPITFAARAQQTYTGGDMISLAGNAFAVDLAAVSGLESSNPGNAAGQLRVKLEAANPTLQIDGSNQLGAKLNAAGAIVTSATGLTNNLEAANPSLQISSNELGLKMDAAGALQKGAGGVSIKVDAATVKINGSNQLESLKKNDELITLGAGDITNQYIDLAFTAQSSGSISLTPMGGPMQTRGVDFTVSLAGGAGGVTRLTFAGDLATGGAAALVSGDKLVASYAYL